MLTQVDQYNQQPLPKQWTPHSTTTTTIFGRQNHLKIASFHDVHLLHRRTITTDILKGFYHLLKDEKEVNSWDMLVIPGDLFDRLESLNNPYLEEILTFFIYLLKLCKKHDITVRVLEGTPAHDFKQSHLFTIMSKVFETMVEDGVDFKHIDELSIEYIEKFDIHVLYVPDEWEIDPMDTYNQVKDLMSAKNLTQVDFCLLHGAFNYQIDAMLNPKAHNENLWVELVKYYTFAGHVHFASQYKNILVAGSFDRLAHGEEQPKGWLTCEIKGTGEHEILFHENPFATIYKTVDVRELSVEAMLEKLKEVLKGTPYHSHIRLHSTNRDAVSDAINELRKLYPKLYFTSKIEKVDTTSVKQLQLVSQHFEAITLTPDNLKRLIQERLSQYPELNQHHVLSVFDKVVQ